MMDNNTIKLKLRLYTNYIIIFCVSVTALIVMPMLSTQLGLELNLPDTPLGWFIYCFTKVMGAIINCLLFHSFMSQAKINVKDDPNFIKAQEILMVIKDEKAPEPRSEQKYLRTQWLTKGLSIFFGSVLGAFAISNAILNYNYNELLSYGIVVGAGIIFGIKEMLNAERYYTVEYLQYALKLQKENELQKEEELKKEEEASTEELKEEIEQPIEIKLEEEAKDGD